MPPETYEQTTDRLSVDPARGEPTPVYRGRRRRDPVETEPLAPEPDPDVVDLRALERSWEPVLSRTAARQLTERPLVEHQLPDHQPTIELPAVQLAPVYAPTEGGALAPGATGRWEPTSSWDDTTAWPDTAGQPAAPQWPVEPMGFEQWAQSLLGEQWAQPVPEVAEQHVAFGQDEVVEHHEAYDHEVYDHEVFEHHEVFAQHEVDDQGHAEPPTCLAPAPQFLTRAEAKAAAALREQRSGSRSGTARSSSVRSGSASRRAAAANVRRAPQRRLVEPDLPPVGPRRYRGLTAAAALATVGALGGAGVLVEQALSTDAAGQAAASMGEAPVVTEAAAVRGTEQALGAARTVTTEQSSTQVAVNDRAFRMVGVSRAQERGPISGCSGQPPKREFANGQIPLSELCAIPFAPGHKLRADAAVRLIRLNEVYKGQFGVDLCMTDSYRSLSSQYSVAARKPGLAARPGTSEHGWGLAIDVCEGPDIPGSERREWMLKHAPEFGWDNPEWARPITGSKPEPWHWEFVEGT